MANNRDDFSAKDKHTLAQRVGYLCSNPGCTEATAGPHSNPGKSLLTGVGSHITAASNGAPVLNSAPLTNPTPQGSPLNSSTPATSGQSVTNLQQQLQPAHQDPVNHPAFGAPPEQEMQKLIAQISDIERPADIGIWPLAPGWWVLFTLLTVATVVGVITLYKTVKRRAYRRSGLRLLKRLGDGSGLSRSGLARQLNEILKRTALASPYYRHLYIGSAHGDAWREFLCSSSPEFPEKSTIVDNLLQSVYR
ncbi:MAG: DUF4381 domain-containing protein, partial [Sphingobacteriaceae bacterium]